MRGHVDVGGLGGGVARTVLVSVGMLVSAGTIVSTLAGATCSIGCSSTADTDPGDLTSANPPRSGSSADDERDGRDVPGDDGDAGTNDGGTELDAAAPRFVDTCDVSKAECTATPVGFGAGDGLEKIDRCAYRLTESSKLGEPVALVEALAKIAPRVSVATVIGDTNRDAVETTSVPGAPAGVRIAFRWQSDDSNSETWIPQGLSGSADADATGLVSGKRIVLSSFYDSSASGGKGVRIAFVDVTNPATPTYRFALLVSPKGSETAPSFGVVDIHAGGIVWFGDYLYVADTTHGFRVFDMKSILRVATDVDQIGCSAGACRAGLYKYVIPQIGKYEVDAVTSACEPLFSFVSLDRGSNPPSLVSGEYCSTTACKGPLTGRVFRWPLDPSTGLLRSKETFPTEAFYMGQTQVQGAAANDGTFYLSSSAPAGGGGALYRVVPNESATSKWSDSPEDLMVDRANGLLWCQSETAGARAVYGVKLSSYPAP